MQKAIVSSQAHLSAYTPPASDSSVHILQDDVNPIRLVFPLDDLGLATFFLAVLYFVLCAASSTRLSRIARFSHGWNTHRIFHAFLVVLTVVRTIGFGILSFFNVAGIRDGDDDGSVGDSAETYPVLITVFMFPEFFFLSAYLLLGFSWAEVFIFSREQYFHDARQYDRFWKVTFILANAVMIITQTVVYIMLFNVDEDKQGQILSDIFLSLGIISLCLPGLVILTWFYLSIRLSGFPFISVMADERSSQMNWITVVWSAGRILRGVMVLLASGDGVNEAPIDISLIQMLMVATTALSEFIPIMVVLDWNIIGVLVLGSDDFKYKSRLLTEVTLGQRDQRFDASGRPKGGPDRRNGGISRVNTISTVVSLLNGAGPRRATSQSSMSQSSAGTEKDALNRSGGNDRRHRYSSEDHLLGADNGNPLLNSASGNQYGDGGLEEQWDDSKWFISPDDLELAHDFPIHSASIVFNIDGRLRGRLVRVKTYRMVPLPQAVVRELGQEVAHISSLRHKHLAEFVGVCVNRTTLHVVTSAYRNGTLWELMRNSKDTSFPFDFILKITLQICRAMKFLTGQAPSVLHYHLSSKNILLDDGMNAIVDSFAESRVMSYMEVLMTRREILTAWSAPELLAGEPPEESSAVYSFGVIMWELLTKREPFRNKEVTELRREVWQNGMRLEVPKSAPKDFRMLIENCFNPARARPTFVELEENLASINDSAM